MSVNQLPQPAREAGVRSSDTIQEALNRLHDTDGLSWREIARLDAFAEIGVPAGTLCSIAAGEPIPHKWRAAFGLPELAPAPVCKCGEVHTTKRCTKYDKPRTRRDLFSYPTAELRVMLDNRKEMR